MNHGYHFFAPEPSFSALVAYRAELPDGSVLDERMPNRGIWPRLLYHRHFMLTEYLNFHDSELQLQLCESYQAHLRQKYQVAEVSLTKVEHLLPSDLHILEGGTLQHPDLWVEIPMSQLREEAAQQAAAQQPAEETSE